MNVQNINNKIYGIKNLNEGEYISQKINLNSEIYNPYKIIDEMESKINIALSKTKKYIILLILLSIIISYLTLEIARNIKYAIDGILCNNYAMIPKYIKNILNNNYMHDLVIFVLIIILLNFINMIINYLRDRITTKFKLKIINNLKLTLYRHTLNLEYKSYNSYEKTEIIQRINEDADVYTRFFSNQFNLILDIIFLSVFIIKESIVLNSIVAAYILITLIIMMAFSLWYFKKLNKNIEEVIDKRKKLLKITLTNVANVKFIRMLNKQKEEKDKYKKLNEEYTKSDIKLIKLILFYEIVNDHITYLSGPILYVLGGIAIIKNKLTIGALSAIITLTDKIFGCFLNLGANLEIIEEFYVVTKKINKILELREEDDDDFSYNLDGDIIFSNVTIYTNNIPILTNLNFIINKGERIAIIGENGKGKSIIAKTILGFYDYDGNIYINNHNIKRLSKNNIRKYIELICGESHMFSGTILENIVLKNEIEGEQLQRIVKDCEIEQDIESFRDKYNTLIGEGGVKLSGGQKQRICIARSLVKNKPIIILDEALNKIDNITRKNILENLKEKYSKRTMILISNNLEIINYVDNIIYITTMKGTHEQLLKRSKDYRNLIQIKENIV